MKGLRKTVAEKKLERSALRKRKSDETEVNSASEKRVKEN